MSFDPFRELNQAQFSRLEELVGHIEKWNRRINLVSRRDVERLWDFHIPHCLMLSYRSFPDDSIVVDWGTGGGLPALVLAIRFPSVQFIAVDRIEKKTMAVRAMARSLEVDNCAAWNGDASDFTDMVDYAVSRATAEATTLWRWTEPRLVQSMHADGSEPTQQRCQEDWLPGLVCLKGGDLEGELDSLRSAYPALTVTQSQIADLTGEANWTDKVIIAITGEENGYS